MPDQKELKLRITTQWPSVVHSCAGGAYGFRTARFGVCRDGVETTCAHCGTTFVYSKPRCLNPADAYQWGTEQDGKGGRR